jgi:hypothetical protein
LTEYIICTVCHKEVPKKMWKQKFCSYECQAIAYKPYMKEYDKTHRNRSPERLQKQRETNKLLRTKLRFIVLTHYSGNPPKCQCCGETEYDFLTIDHINGRGHELKRTKQEPRTGNNLYRWIIGHNFPNDLNVLCYNCNCGRAKNKEGICPHKRKKI